MIWGRELTVTTGTDKKTIKVCVYILANRVRNHYRLVIIKDTHREKAPSSKPPVLTDSMNMDGSLVQ